MAKSYINVVQDYPGTRLGIPYESTKPTPTAGRPLGLTDQPCQLGKEKDPSPHRRYSPVHPDRVTGGVNSDAISTGFPHCLLIVKSKCT